MEQALGTAFAIAALLCAVSGVLSVIMALLLLAQRAVHEASAPPPPSSMPAVPAGPSWTLTYKNGRKIQTVTVAASTEQEAVAAAMRLSIPFDKIVSLVKN